jgi:LysR family glycine cleavage system transcriptional activator
MRKVPSLPSPLALRAFESVARLGSASRAAEELLITQSAVSHHLRKLEQEVGAELLVRRARGMELTDAGRRYFDVVRQAFGMIANGTAEVRAGSSRRVRVSLLPSFAAHWLTPRLSRFRSAHPTIVLDLDPTTDQADFDRDGTDLALRYGDGRWPGMAADLFMTERLTPVTTPSQAGAVASLPLLMTKKAFDWRLWSRETGFDLDAPPKLQLTDYNIVLQAALNGEGVALGRLRIMGDLLLTGVLVSPFNQVVASPEAAYWVVSPAGRRLSTAAQLFVDWLKAEASAMDDGRA